MKVLLLTNIISPYRIPLFNYLRKRKDFNFKIVALAENEENRDWEIAREQIQFDYQVLPGLHKFIWSKELPIHLNWGLWRMLRRYNPDIIVTSGYDALAYWEAFLYCKIFNKKYILWDGTTLLSSGSIKGIRGMLKNIIINGADKYIAYGKKSKEYLEYFGAKPKNIYVSLNTVDVEYFRKEILKLRNKDGFLAKRKKYPKVLLLYVGQLIKRKALLQVLKALNLLRDRQIGFLIVGSGPEEDNLKRFCKEYSLHNIFFEGFHQLGELPKYYALSDIFILPSYKEVWGLTINEALASGLYVLCSDRAGAAYDLIKEKWNGAMFDPYNVEETSMLIQQTKVRIDEIRARREAISEHACRKFSIERSAEAFLEAVKYLNGGT